MVMKMALFESKANFAQDLVIIIFHKANLNYCYGQMNQYIIGFHDFCTDPSSNGLFEALSCVIPEDHKALELETTQQSFSLISLPLTPILFYSSQNVNLVKVKEPINSTSYSKVRPSVSPLLIPGSFLLLLITVFSLSCLETRA